jgi:hypothetical protein
MNDPNEMKIEVPIFSLPINIPADVTDDVKAPSENIGTRA